MTYFQTIQTILKSRNFDVIHNLDDVHEITNDDDDFMGYRRVLVFDAKVLEWDTRRQNWSIAINQMI